MALYIRSGDKMPDKWYKKIEMARERAKCFMGELVAIHQTNSVVVGRMASANIERLWQVRYPYCKITMKRAFRFSVNGDMEADLGNDGLFWVNSPDIILTMDELSRKFPKVYTEVLPKIKTGVW